MILSALTTITNRGLEDILFRAHYDPIRRDCYITLDLVGSLLAALEVAIRQLANLREVAQEGVLEEVVAVRGAGSWTDSWVVEGFAADVAGIRTVTRYAEDNWVAGTAVAVVAVVHMGSSAAGNWAAGNWAESWAEPHPGAEEEPL